MIQSIRYLGPLISNLSIPGERKADGVIPAHPGCVQLSKDRFLLLATSLETGWDAVRSVCYQVRAGSPDGPEIREGVLAGATDDWDALGDGRRFSKMHGMGLAFGVPKGAVRDGKPLPSANVFVLKYYRKAGKRGTGGVMLKNDPKISVEPWPEGSEVVSKSMGVEWLQFRLNDAEDDIEVIQPAAPLTTDAPRHGDWPGGTLRVRNHSMTPAIAMDDACTRWTSIDAVRGEGASGQAAVLFEFNASRGRYEWTYTGPKYHADEDLGETSVAKVGDQYVVAFRMDDQLRRGEPPTYFSVFFRTPDPLAQIGQAAYGPGQAVPQHLYRCGDGELRLFTSMRVGWRRNPLVYYNVAGDLSRFDGPHTLVDAKAVGLPFHTPCLDMSKLCPAQGRRQLLVFRAITVHQTANLAPVKDPNPPTADEHAAAGVHAVELVYSRGTDTWTFA